jgi:hypothetical protein
MKQQEKCAHPSCACPAATDSRYCGAYCEGARETSEINCSCGHPNCSSPAEK